MARHRSRLQSRPKRRLVDSNNGLCLCGGGRHAHASGKEAGRMSFDRSAGRMLTIASLGGYQPLCHVYNGLSGKRSLRGRSHVSI